MGYTPGMTKKRLPAVKPRVPQNETPEGSDLSGVDFSISVLPGPLVKYAEAYARAMVKNPYASSEDQPKAKKQAQLPKKR